MNFQEKSLCNNYFRIVGQKNREGRTAKEVFEQFRTELIDPESVKNGSHAANVLMKHLRIRAGLGCSFGATSTAWSVLVRVLFVLLTLTVHQFAMMAKLPKEREPLQDTSRTKACQYQKIVTKVSERRLAQGP